MFAVCSFATAQNSDLRSAKTAKKTTTPAITNAAAAKPEKAAVNKHRLRKNQQLKRKLKNRESIL